eukprot:TRINITY_DN19581_c0_g1_i1.p1 TRINITY_DN19581_c0_g1~~TRINITY_DN19581_c0_g1_i1.p1  ORF type:complete len:400 (+),score=50.34 TRINITY_DN19581_c0_g1_i1:24-1223(+)
MSDIEYSVEESSDDEMTTDGHRELTPLQATCLQQRKRIAQLEKENAELTKQRDALAWKNRRLQQELEEQANSPARSKTPASPPFSPRTPTRQIPSPAASGHVCSPKTQHWITTQFGKPPKWEDEDDALTRREENHLAMLAKRWWTPDEDRLLQRGVALFGTQWKKIKADLQKTHSDSLICQRTDGQLKDHWRTLQHKLANNSTETAKKGKTASAQDNKEPGTPRTATKKRRQRETITSPVMPASPPPPCSPLWKNRRRTRQSSKQKREEEVITDDDEESTIQSPPHHKRRLSFGSPTNRRASRGFGSIGSPRRASGALVLRAAKRTHSRVGQWSQEEDDALIAGVKQYGVGAWAKILSSNRAGFCNNRNNISLKDRWRTLQGVKKGKKAPSSPTGSLVL